MYLRRKKKKDGENSSQYALRYASDQTSAKTALEARREDKRNQRTSYLENQVTAGRGMGAKKRGVGRGEQSSQQPGFVHAPGT